MLLDQQREYDQFYNSQLGNQDLLNNVRAIYFERQQFNERKHNFYKHLECIKEGQNLIEIIKTCIREYASHLLQKLTSECFFKVQKLWELHYSLETTSYEIQELIMLYYQLFQTKPYPKIDCVKLNFQQMRLIILEIPKNSRKIHQAFRVTHMKPKKSLILIFDDQYIPTKEIQKKKQQNKESTPLNEIKLFELRISSTPKQPKLEPYLTKQWINKLQNMLHKIKS